MKKLIMLAALIAMAVPTFAAETWTNVPIVDTSCAAKAKANPDAHTRACALQCEKGGYGIVTSDGTYLKFDAAGNAKASAALKQSKQTDHLRVTVTGERDGDNLKVSSLKM
ncbi:MAG: hypothetical protein ABI383_00650 [Acidobacteriaceae bacterium]